MRDKTRNEKKSRGMIRSFLYLFPIVTKAAPAMFVMTCFISVLSGFSWAVVTMVQQNFFDNATEFVVQKTAISAVITALLLLGGIHILCQALNALANFVSDAFEDKVIGKLGIRIHEKIGRLRPILFEDTDTLDHINKAGPAKTTQSGSSSWFAIFLLIISRISRLWDGIYLV